MKIGEQAEQQAGLYLQQHGLKLIARNFRARFGEIDLIMEDSGTLVFIEVRLRTGTDFGGAIASISIQKQKRIIRAAQLYLTRLTRIPPCRFDVLLFDNENVQWIKNAFET